MTMSPPIRRCGLKYLLLTVYLCQLSRVTSYTEVWIEISMTASSCRCTLRHLLYGGVDWNPVPISINRAPTCHLLYGGVDWNSNIIISTFTISCHLLYGGVDWNEIYMLIESGDTMVTSYTEVWIEILNQHLEDNRVYQSHLLYGGVDWNYSCKVVLILNIWSPPIRRCGLKFQIHLQKSQDHQVTSYTEVWIEITYILSGFTKFCSCHLPYGGVDWNKKSLT